MKDQVQQGIQKRQEIFNKIIDYIQAHGYSPTTREIGKLVGLRSTSSVKAHLDKMLMDGTIETDHEYCPRAIRIPGYRFVNEEIIDSMYLEKCKEINELKKQVATLQEAAGKLKDDFIERFIYKAVCEGCSGCCNCYENDGRYECEDYKEYMKIAEQLKEGRKSE